MTGQDTTASAITWMVKYLDENPKALNNLRVTKNILFDSVYVIFSNLKI